jgi:NAD(P)-dependent dehydrogenase (short-subunit alcohol dehydrogenase family)
MIRIALVTGASAGIGEATARQLIERGWRVFAAARRLDRMKELEAVGATLLPLDLTDDASIVAAVETIRREAGRLDLLVNNAGYGSYGALEDVPMDEARRQVEVNLFGLARLYQLTTPMMRAQRSGTIVNVTSIGGRFGEPFGSWYHATKFAVEGLSDCLRMELRPFGIRVVIVEPGAIRTEWAGIAHESLVERSGKTDYAPYALRHAAMLGSADTSSIVSPPDVVAKGIARIADTRNPKARYAIGGGAKMFMFLRNVLPDSLLDQLMWRVSQSGKLG